MVCNITHSYHGYSFIAQMGHALRDKLRVCGIQVQRLAAPREGGGALNTAILRRVMDVPTGDNACVVIDSPLVR